MKVRIEIAGFGDDRPRAFGGNDEIVVELPEGAPIAVALAAAGLDGVPGIAVLLNDRSVGDGDRGATVLHDGDDVAVLYAIEGG